MTVATRLWRGASRLARAAVGAVGAGLLVSAVALVIAVPLWALATVAPRLFTAGVILVGAGSALAAVVRTTRHARLRRGLLTGAGLTAAATLVILSGRALVVAMGVGLVVGWIVWRLGGDARPRG